MAARRGRPVGREQDAVTAQGDWGHSHIFPISPALQNMNFSSGCMGSGKSPHFFLYEMRMLSPFLGFPSGTSGKEPLAT